MCGMRTNAHETFHEIFIEIGLTTLIGKCILLAWKLLNYRTYSIGIVSKIYIAPNQVYTTHARVLTYRIGMQTSMLGWLDFLYWKSIITLVRVLGSTYTFYFLDFLKYFSLSGAYDDSSLRSPLDTSTPRTSLPSPSYLPAWVELPYRHQLPTYLWRCNATSHRPPPQLLLCLTALAIRLGSWGGGGVPPPVSDVTLAASAFPSSLLYTHVDTGNTDLYMHVDTGNANLET